MTNYCYNCERDIGSAQDCDTCPPGTKQRIRINAKYSVQITVLAVVNEPLALQPLESTIAAKLLPNEQQLLQSFADKSISIAPTVIVSQYKHIRGKEHKRLLFAPNDPTILERIISPLKHAKASYLLGNYLGCIALCGLVGEMLAVMLFEMNEADLLGKQFHSNSTALIADVAWFEKQKASERLFCLRDNNIIDSTVFNALNSVRSTRNDFLHVYSQSYRNIQNRAETVYEKTVEAVHSILGQDIRGNTFYLADKLRNWLFRKE